MEINGQQTLGEKHTLLSQMISESIMNGAIWKSLGYATEIVPWRLTHYGNSIEIKLIDKILNHQQIEDLKKSSMYNIAVLTAVHTKIRINDARLVFRYQDIATSCQLLVKHLNYLMFCSYIDLQSRAPLAFSFSSRTKYSASFEFTTSLVQSFTKSDQTSVIAARAINAGFLKQTINTDFARYLRALTKSQRRRMKDEKWLILQFFVEFEMKNY